MQPPCYVSQPDSERSSAVGRIPEPQRRLHDNESHVTTRIGIRSYPLAYGGVVEKRTLGMRLTDARPQSS